MLSCPAGMASTAGSVGRRTLRNANKRFTAARRAAIAAEEDGSTIPPPAPPGDLPAMDVDSGDVESYGLHQHLRCPLPFSALDIVKVATLELPDYLNPWMNPRSLPENGVIPDGFGHDKFSYILDDERHELTWIRPLPSSRAFTLLLQNILLPHRHISRPLMPTPSPAVKKPRHGPLNDMLELLGFAAAHFCPRCKRFACSTCPVPPRVWPIELGPIVKPTEADRPCGAECHLHRLKKRMVGVVEPPAMRAIIKAWLMEDVNGRQPTYCQLAELVDLPCRYVWRIADEVVASCKDSNPKMIRPVIPSSRPLPFNMGKQHRGKGLAFQYRPCHHPRGLLCSDPRSKCPCPRNTGSRICHEACGCPADCEYRRPHPCPFDCTPTQRHPECECRALKYVCATCNVRADFGQTKKTLCGRSTVAGIGTFIMENVKQGAFIDEYTGELIGVEEADHRANYFAERYGTYQFVLNMHMVVDASDFGSKMRFVNHSLANQNVEACVVMERGQQRIGFFAARDLQAGEELFVSYHGPAEEKPKGRKRKACPEESPAEYMRKTVRDYVDVKIKEKVPREPGLVHAEAPAPRVRFAQGNGITVTAVNGAPDAMDGMSKVSVMQIVDAAAHDVVILE
ncbi:uncharacterized protein LOC129590996 [Paramacrobiotus metropolitanus]|uniref:uncharacterized protein LOC129590996 n=1 Tax=Paramacrobiotus metropolitanus TaxID=2943436 RepID=UPI002445CC4E|nr:uncharacterized protein LOC129590996 [Paramacrobiotus metropolitanus]